MIYAPTAVELVRRWEDMLTRDATWRQLWQELADFTVPPKSDVTVKRTPGEKRTHPNLYDSTAPSAVGTLASAIHGSVTSPVSLWTGLEFDLEELRGDEESADWLVKGNRKMYRRIQDSNFDSEIQEVYTEVASMGTGAIFVDAAVALKTARNPSGFGGFRVQSMPVGYYAISENEFGFVDTLFSEIWMPVRSAIKKFGASNVHDSWTKKNSVKPDESVRMLHCVFPRDGGSAAVGTSNKRLPWASCWIDPEYKVKLAESGFREFPYAVVRWTKQARELWGRGPGEIALPDIRTLNEAVKLRLQAWALAVRPPMEAKHRGIIGKVSTQPSAVNYSREMGNLRALDFGAKFDVANFNEEKIRESIKAIFFIDKLQLPDKSIITATEAMQRVRAMHRILGPALGRLDYELLRPIVRRMFSLMLHAGEFDPIPGAVLDAAENDIAKINVTFDGPLARAQRVQDLESTNEFVGAVLPLAQVVPAALDNVDFDKYVQKAARSTSQTELLRTVADRDEMRAERAEAQAAAQQAAEERENAKAMGQSAPAMKVMAEQPEPMEPAV